MIEYIQECKQKQVKLRNFKKLHKPLRAHTYRESPALSPYFQISDAVNIHNWCICQSAGTSWLVSDPSKVGRGGGREVASHRPLISNDLGSQGPSSLTVWSENTQQAQWKAALLWDRQHSPSGSNITVTHTLTSHVIRIQKSGCITRYQTETNVHPFPRSALWECTSATRTGFHHGWNILLIKFQVWILHEKASNQQTGSIYMFLCNPCVCREGTLQFLAFLLCGRFFFHLYIETVMEYNPEASRDGIKAKGIWVIATIKRLPGLVEL